MTTEIELSDARDQVLRKIGRNAVNFQKMEAMLKVLNSHQSLSGSLSDIPRLAAKAKKLNAKRPMGELANAFIKSAYASAKEDGTPADPKAITIAFHLRLESEPTLVSKRKGALRSVVTERNKLLHQWLAEVDPNSMDSCKTLGAKLDEQHKRIWPEFEALSSIVQAVREHYREVAEYLSSDAFLTELKARSTSNQ